MFRTSRREVQVVIVLAILMGVAGGRVAAQSAVARQQDMSREAWQKVPEIFSAMGIGPGAVVADVGAGDGFLTSRLARVVGSDGRVLAVDVDARAVERLRARVEGDALTNVTFVKDDTNDPHLPHTSLDAAVIVNAYHEMVEYQAMLQQLRAALKPGGRLVIVEPISEKRLADAREDQTKQHEIAARFVEQEARDAGFRIQLLQDPFTSRGLVTEWLIVAVPDQSATTHSAAPTAPPTPAVDENAEASPDLRMTFDTFKHRRAESLDRDRGRSVGGGISRGTHSRRPVDRALGSERPSGAAEVVAEADRHVLQLTGRADKRPCGARFAKSRTPEHVGGDRRICEMEIRRQSRREGETMNSASLERRLGPLDAASIVVANVIGIGMFTAPAFVATIVPDPIAILIVWICGGVLAFLGALAYAELAARRPLAGGEYVYLRESFGEHAAFLTGWTSFVAGFSGAIAAGALGVTTYLDRLIPGTANSKPIAIGLIGLLALVHARGLGSGRVLQLALTLVKVGALIAFVAIGFASTHSHAATTFAREPIPASALLFAMVPVMFSYSGWNAAAYIAEEVREPSRNVPLGLAIGTVVVVALYVMLNALYVLSPERTVSSGAFGFNAVAIVIMLSSLSAMTLAGPRVYFAMARDGAFFSAAARVHERYRTPATAITAQAAWSSLLVVSRTFEQLLTYTGFAVILFSGLAVLSLFVNRRRALESPTFRTWGYPWAPAIFCVVSFVIVVNAIVTAPGASLAGLGVIAAGLPMHWWTRARRETKALRDSLHAGVLES